MRFRSCSSRDARNPDQRPPTRPNREADTHLSIFISRSFTSPARSRKATHAAIQYALRVGARRSMGNTWQPRASMVCSRNSSSSPDKISKRSEWNRPVHSSGQTGRCPQSVVERAIQERQESQFHRIGNDLSRLEGGGAEVQIRQKRRQPVRGACFQVAGISSAVICPETGSRPDASQARLTVRFNQPPTCGIYLAVARDGRLFVCRLSQL